LRLVDYLHYCIITQHINVQKKSFNVARFGANKI
jgi:hypothetical protein